RTALSGGSWRAASPTPRAWSSTCGIACRSITRSGTCLCWPAACATSSLSSTMSCQAKPCRLARCHDPSAAPEGLIPCSHRLRMAWLNQVCGGGVGLHLLDTLAPGDDGRDGRMLQAPGERPLRHRHAGRHLFAGDALDLGQLAIALLSLVPPAHLAGVEGMAGLVLARQVPAGQRHPRQHPQVLLPADREGRHLRRALQAVVDDLDELDLLAG